MHFHYREWLIQRFQEAKGKNPSYSLRAYAKSLGVSAPFILNVMRGKAFLSGEKTISICKRLNLSEDLCNLLVYSQQFEKSKDKQVRERLENQMRLILEKKKLKQLPLVTLKPISQWESFAFLALLSLPHSKKWKKSDYLEILSCSNEQFDAMITVFLKQGAVRITDTGAYESVESHIVLKSGEVQPDLKKIHQSLLPQVNQAISQQAPTQRYSASEFVTLDEGAISKIHELTESYLNEVQLIARKVENPDRVYSVSLHLFNSFPEKTL